MRVSESGMRVSESPGLLASEEICRQPLGDWETRRLGD